MSYKTLTYQVKDNIARLEICNPPQNTMRLEFFDELLDVCEKQIKKENFSGLIITSAGRHFSSGADVNELTMLIKNNKNNLVPAEMKKNLQAIHILHKLQKPKVAILKGICYGSGFELALTANYRIAQKNTLIALPEVTFGLMPGLGGISALTYIVGESKALELILSGRSIDSNEALSLGLIDKICNKESIEEEAVKTINANYKKTMEHR